jgi:manganese transport protein
MSASTNTTNPYQRTTAAIRRPPSTFFGSLRFLGPGFILSASIVGSGELIATTIVGAKAGFVLLWFIIFSCIIKVAVQLEFGRHAISTGETTMTAFNSLPGPRLRGTNWSIWTWLILMATKLMQVGGIVGGVVLGLEILFAGFSEIDLTRIRTPMIFIVAASVSLLVHRGYYLLLEKASLIMIGLFTLFTVVSLIALQSTDLAIQWPELVSGVIPNIPADKAILFVAMGAFGITGVGGDEIMAYNYWLIEKGYAAYTGPREETRDWEDRAKGWIRVMYWDAILAMICYTFVTAMFYLLGAAVLHRNGTVPQSDQLIETLATMYTQVLGPSARLVFVAGAVIVLYSTLFAALAAWTRLFSDAFGQIGLYDFQQRSARRHAIAFFAWLFPILWGFTFLFLEAPALMVIVGGFTTVIILLIVVYATLYFRYYRLDPRLRPSLSYDIALWISSVSILLVAVVAATKI